MFYLYTGKRVWCFYALDLQEAERERGTNPKFLLYWHLQLPDNW